MRFGASRASLKASNGPKKKKDEIELLVVGESVARGKAVWRCTVWRWRSKWTSSHGRLARAGCLRQQPGPLVSDASRPPELLSKTTTDGPGGHPRYRRFLTSCRDCCASQSAAAYLRPHFSPSSSSHRIIVSVRNFGSMVDGDDYLQEGFDPRSVTVPRLRSILVTHSVEFPSTAKKPQLVELVTDRVLSQASRLRAERARAKRSSFGIVNAGSAEDTITWDDHQLQPPRPASRRSRSPMKSSARRKTVEPEVEPPSHRASRKSTSRSVSRPLSGVDDDDATEDVTKSKRRSRRTMTPHIKTESDEDQEQVNELRTAKAEESVFTDDNPFQSGSSPPAIKSAAHRRRTAGDEFFKDVRSSGRRSDGAIRKSSAVARLRPATPEEPMEPGEEFTPNEQLELERAERAGEVYIAPRKSQAVAGRQTNLKTPLLALLVALLTAYGAWYRQEKIAVGYCGLGRPAKTILPPEVPIPGFLQPFVEIQCEPCPLHAYCYQDFSVRCESDFILEPHPLSLGGLIPLPPSCEPDGEKARRVQAVADKAVEELRERRAQFECGAATDETGQQQTSPAMSEEELKDSVSKKRSKRLSQREFDELWKAAIGEVTARDEVVVEQDESPDSLLLPRVKLASTSLAQLPLTCAVRRSLWHAMARYRLPLGLVALVAQVVFYLRAKYRRHLATSAQVPGLVDVVLGRLANQKELGEEDLDDPWLFLPNLRDDVLRNVHSLAERERIWHKVRLVVEQNSNVRTGQREGRSGEVGRAWEWIGPVKGEGARRRRSGRVSWAPEATSETPEVRETVEAKKWDEPRPYY
ncbi:hypothetical protein XA68_15062 [Ophiocordyceps unilateralis]|uniref:Man1/Src1 C-terminal domain-containing protein n=1 Tax=Ophiocordyceps unilateralis TaxID=268505 RepID=A0A2A9PM25_OPHUN|nr:hypothetical protein XA68_15062 [Ophiocordyceps unilateralis]